MDESPHIVIRALRSSDDLEQLTGLLHRAYAQLADLGLRFVATHQDVNTTRERVNEGECYVAELNGKIVGTVVFRDCEQTEGCPWYDRKDVASFGQYAVEPTLQGKGIGGALLDHVEERAKACGAAEIALDTAEPAKHLIELYEKRGYRIVDRTKWDVVNYSSVIMSKPL
jgi:GNAT superfamily N-acetyltransferase